MANGIPRRRGPSHLTDVPQPLIPVGKNCDCGHPLVWWRDTQRCAVYGSHPTLVHMRNVHAPASRLVNDIGALDRRLRAVS